MTKASNLKLHIYKCSCGSFKRGSEFKKHLSQNSEHRLLWKRLVCTSCWKHAPFDSQEFLKTHSGCNTQTKTSNTQLCSWLGSVAKEHATVDLDEECDGLFSDDDFEEESKPELSRQNFIAKIEQKKQEPTCVDELAAAIRNITEDPACSIPAAAAVDSIPPATDSIPPAAAASAPAVPSSAPAVASSTPVTSSSTPAVASVPDLASSTPVAASSTPVAASSTPSTLPTPTTSSTPSAPTPRIVKGIQRQNKKWAADCRTSAISRNKATENLMDRHTALQARYAALLKDFEDECRTNRKTKQLQEENLALQSKLTTTGKLLTDSEKKVSNLICRLEYASTEVEMLHKKNAELAKKAEKVTPSSANSTRADLHIPVQYNLVCDRILAYTEDAEEVECYNDPSSGINCLHVKVIMAGGEVSVSNQRVRKRAARPLQEPAAQTPRHY